MRTIAGEIHPMLCGSAFKNKGVQRMLDAVIDFMPSPIDIPPVPGTDDDDKPVARRARDTEPFSALAFKLMTDPYVGQLTFVRVYSGVLKSGDSVFNAIRGKKERIGRILQMHANQREEIKEILAGDIAACVGLRRSHDRRDAVRSAGDHHAREDGVPGAGDFDRGRAEDQGRSGEDGRRPRPAGRRKIRRSASRPTRNRPDHHFRHGRAASRNHRRSHEARVRRRGQRRQAAGAYRETIRKAVSDVEGKFVASRAARASTATSC